MVTINSTGYDLQNNTLLPSYTYSATVWCLSFLLVFTAPFNILIIFLLSQQKKAINTCGFITYAISLAVTDALVGLIIIPISVAQFVIEHWPLGRVSCLLFQILDYGLTSVSVYLMAAMGYDRYQCVTSPLSYRVNFLQRRIIATTVVIWLLGIGAWVPGLTVPFLKKYPDRLFGFCLFENSGYLALPYVLIMYFLPLVFTIIIYVKMVCYLKRRFRLKSATDGRQTVSYMVRYTSQTFCQLSAGAYCNRDVSLEPIHLGTSPHHSRRGSDGDAIPNMKESQDCSRTSAKHLTPRLHSQNLRCLKTSMLVVLCFVLSWGPACVIWTITQFCPECIDYDLSQAIGILCYANSTVNPFIYLATSAQVREDFKKLIMRKKHQSRVPVDG